MYKREQHGLQLTNNSPPNFKLVSVPPIPPQPTTEMQFISSFLFFSLLSLVVASVHPKDVDPAKIYALHLSTDEGVVLAENGWGHMSVFDPSKVSAKRRSFKFPYGIPEKPNTVQNGGYIHILGGTSEKLGGGLLYSRGSVVFDSALLNDPEEHEIQKMIAVPFEDGIKMRWAGQPEYWFKAGSKFRLFPFATKWMIHEAPMTLNATTNE